MASLLCSSGSSSFSRMILRRLSRSESTSSSTLIHRSLQPHEFVEPCNYLGSWKRPKDPREAARKLEMLRRDYKEQVKEYRKKYIYEMELQRLEKQRKDDARMEKIRLEREARKAEKEAAAKTRAAERKVAEEEFMQILIKERADKLAHWKKMEAKTEQMKSTRYEHLRKQSAMWADEEVLNAKILEAVCNVRPL